MITYPFAVHCALIVILFAGIVLGISTSHPANVYPVFVGFAGAVIVVA